MLESDSNPPWHLTPDVNQINGDIIDNPKRNDVSTGSEPLQFVNGGLVEGMYNY